MVCKFTWTDGATFTDEVPYEDKPEILWLDLHEYADFRVHPLDRRAYRAEFRLGSDGGYHQFRGTYNRTVRNRYYFRNGVKDGL